MSMALIQVRNVPESLHRLMKERAAREGLTLSDLALAEFRRAMASPTRDEIRARLAALPRGSYNGETGAESTRAERDAR